MSLNSYSFTFNDIAKKNGILYFISVSSLTLIFVLNKMFNAI